MTKTQAPTPTDTPIITISVPFDIIDTVLYPDPVFSPGDFTLRLKCTSKPVSVRMKIYSVSFRLIRDLSWRHAEITGNYDVLSPASCLDNCAGGVYYYEISAVGDDGKETKSMAKPFIMIR